MFVCSGCSVSIRGKGPVMTKRSWVYVWIPGIPGGVREKGYAGWIEAKTTDFSLRSRSSMGSSSGGGAATSSLANVVRFSLAPGAASSRLAVVHAQGRPIEKVKIDFLSEARHGKQRALACELGSVFVTQFRSRANFVERQSLDVVELAFRTIKQTRFAAGAPTLDAGVPDAWNLKKG